MSRRGRFVAGGAVITAAIAYLIWAGVSQSVVYFVTPSELLASPVPSKTYRLGARLPSGMKQTVFIPFEASKWASLFGPPAITFSQTLKKVQGLVFVGNSANAVVFYALRVEGFEPACP